jgi:vanillate/3-O-methylgallate O-demethylase
MTINAKEMRGTPPGYFTSRWGLPEYTDWQDESLSWKEACYIGDWSFLWTATFKGPDAFSFLRDLTVNSFEDFAVGQAKHVINCNEYGKVVTEGILLRLGKDEFCAQSNPAWWYGFQFEQGRHDAQMTRPDIFNYQVQGPTSIAVIEKACGESVRDVPFMHFKTIPRRWRLACGRGCRARWASSWDRPGRIEGAWPSWRRARSTASGGWASGRP